MDPLDANWDRLLAGTLVRQVQQSVDAERVERLSAEAMGALEHWTLREPISFLTWRYAGERAMDLAAAADKFDLPSNEYLQKSLYFFTNAVESFPSDIQLRLQLAVSCVLVGDLPTAEKQLSVAQDLDRSTPHLDRKLQSQMVWFPSLSGGLSSAERVDGSWSRAELVVNWLRSRL